MKMDPSGSQDVARMRTNFSLVTKHILSEKVHVVVLHNKIPAYQNYWYKEEAYYVNDQMRIFRPTLKKIKVGTSIRTTTST